MKRTPSAGLGSVATGAVTALALAVQTGLAAVVGVIIAREFGRTAETDGFFAAYAVFVVLALAATSTRVVVLPSLARARLARSLRSETFRFAFCIVVVAVPALAVVIAAAGPVAAAITGFGPPAAREQAASVLPWMVAAATGQFFAGLASSALAALDDYVSSAVGYGLGSALGLAFIVWRVSPDGIEAVAWGMALNAVVATLVPAAALFVRARREGREALDGVRVTPVPGPALGPGGRLALLGRGVALPFALQAVYLVCLALAGREGIGAATTLGYAFLIGSAIVAVTAGSLGLVTAVPMTVSGMDTDDVARHVDAASWVAFVGIAGAAGLSSIVGGAVIGHVLGASYVGDVGQELGRVVAALAPWMVVSTGISLVYPLVFVLGRLRHLPSYSLGIVALHVPLAVLGVWAGGLYGLVVAMAISTCVGLAAMLRQLGGASVVLRDLGRGAGVVGALGAIAFVPSGVLLGPTAAAIVGALAYVGLLLLVRPSGLRRSWRYLRALS